MGLSRFSEMMPLCSCHLRMPPSPKERRRHSRRSSLHRRASCFCSSLKLEKDAFVIMDWMHNDRQVVSRLLTAICIADRPRIVTPVATWFCFCLWHWLSLAGWKTKLEKYEDCPQKRKEGWCRPHSRLNLVLSSSAS